MKIPRIFAVLVCLLACPFLAQARIPTPRQAIEFNTSSDASTKWDMGFATGNREMVFSELVHQGESVEKWTELVTVRTVFSGKKATLEERIAAWRKTLGTSTEVSEEKQTDGTYLVTYSSKAADEFGMYRFIRGEDGFYEIGFALKLSAKKDDRVTLWRDILLRAKLEPNPVLRK